MGAGQGFERGVQMVGSFLMPALQHRMQQKRYDADRAVDQQRYNQQNERYDKRLSQMDKQYYDQLAMQQKFMEVMYGNGGGDGGANMLQPQTAPQPQAPTPYQVTRPASQAELLAGQFTHPNPGYQEQADEPAPQWTHPNPPSPAEALSIRQPTPTMMSTHVKPIVSSYRGPSPSSTPFSAASSNPHTEQRTLSAPKDPSMVMKKMPEVTHQQPDMRQVGATTRLPPMSMMRPPSVRRGF